MHEQKEFLISKNCEFDKLLIILAELLMKHYNFDKTTF
jgi:hypothetical protein